MKIFWNSLRARLIFAFVAVAAAAILAVSVIQQWQVGGALLADSGALLHARAEAEVGLMGAALDARVDHLRALAVGRQMQEAIRLRYAGYPEGEAARQIADEDARWPALDAADPLIAGVLNSPLADELRAQARLDPNLAELILADRRGALVAAGARTTDYYQADEEWWQQAAADGLYMSTPAFDSSSGSFSIILAVGVYEDDGAFAGVLRSTYRTDAISLKLAEQRFGPGAKADLLIGDAILKPGGSRLGTLSAADAAAIEQARSATYSLGQYEGLPRLITVVPIPADPRAGDVGWSIVLYQNRADALASVDSARRLTIGTALLVLAAAAAVAFVLAGLISTPIQKITATAERIAAGDLAQRVGVLGDDEIGRLARGFDQMAASLQERIDAEQAAQAGRLRLQQEMIEAQDRRIEELAAPTIPIGHDTLLLPLIGSVDERRADHVLQTLLADVRASRARTVLLDLSGVRDLDAQVVASLMRAAAGVRLIGARVALVGIRAQLARTITDLDIDLAGIPIYARLQDALKQI